jgi:hypothetical protein
LVDQTTSDTETQRQEEAIMPGGDRTGPLGCGPLTGGGRGSRAGCGVRGAWEGPGFARGGFPVAGWGCGGRGYRHRYYATGIPFSAYGPEPESLLDADQEVSLLKTEAERLRAMLDRIEQRLERLTDRDT